VEEALPEDEASLAEEHPEVEEGPSAGVLSVAVEVLLEVEAVEVSRVGEAAAQGAVDSQEVVGEAEQQEPALWIVTGSAWYGRFGGIPIIKMCLGWFCTARSHDEDWEWMTMRRCT